MLIQNKPDFTAVSKISSRIAIDISKHTTFGRMDEQTWIETELIGDWIRRKRYKKLFKICIRIGILLLALVKSNKS